MGTTASLFFSGVSLGETGSQGTFENLFYGAGIFTLALL